MPPDTHAAGRSIHLVPQCEYPAMSMADSAAANDKPERRLHSSSHITIGGKSIILKMTESIDIV